MLNSSYKKRVAVLRGGPSSEYEVSMKTGAHVINTLINSPFDTKDIVISKKGEWLSHGFVRSPLQALVDVDVAFIALHGHYGEDGTVQRILNRLAIPYTGSGSYASALAMNKALTKDFLKPYGIKMAKHMRVSAQINVGYNRIADSIGKMFGPQYIIKPINGGSSIGIVVAEGVNELVRALENLMRTYDEVLVEERIFGKEVTVGVLNNFRNTNMYTFPVNEIVLGDSYTYQSAEAKSKNEVMFICPGIFSQVEKKELSEAATKVHTLLNISQYSRSDFIVNDSGIYFLEINTQPPLHKNSAFVKSFESVGVTQSDVIEQLLTTAACTK